MYLLLKSTPYDLAHQGGHETVAKYLEDSGSRINARDKKTEVRRGKRGDEARTKNVRLHELLISFVFWLFMRINDNSRRRH